MDLSVTVRLCIVHPSESAPIVVEARAKAGSGSYLDAKLLAWKITEGIKKVLVEEGSCISPGPQDR